MGRRRLRVDAPVEADVSTWWTRGEVAEQLGCSTMKIRLLEQRRRLAFEIDKSGAHRFNPTLVKELVSRMRANKEGKKIPARSEAAIVADIYRMLREGKSQEDIVITLCVSPEMVAHAYEQWRCRSHQELLWVTQRAQREAKQREEEDRQRREMEEHNKMMAQLIEQLSGGSSSGREDK